MHAVKIYADGSACVFSAFAGRKSPDGKPSGHFFYESEKRRKAHVSAIARKIKVLCCVMSWRYACFFTVTSAGRLGRITGQEIDRLFTYLRNCHGLRSYLWVREKTKAGADHLHVVAEFKPGYRMKYWIGENAKAPVLSRWWSKVLGQGEAANSIRFGWYDKTGRRRFYLSRNFGGGYLAKYLNKDSERSGGRKLGVSDNLQPWAEPVRLNYGLADLLTDKFAYNGLTGKYQQLVDTVKVLSWKGKIFPVHWLLKKFDWQKVGDDDFFVWWGLIREKKGPELPESFLTRSVKQFPDFDKYQRIVFPV